MSAARDRIARILGKFSWGGLTMKLRTLIPLIALFSRMASAQTTTIPIFNAQFTLDTASCLGYYCAQQGVTGWIAGPQTYIIGFTGYSAALMAGNVTLASGNSATPVGGTYVDEVIVYESGPNPPQLGQPCKSLSRVSGPDRSTFFPHR
jgi:hypothetical protein